MAHLERQRVFLIRDPRQVLQPEIGQQEAARDVEIFEELATLTRSLRGARDVVTATRTANAAEVCDPS